MIDIILELLRVIVVGGIIVAFLSVRRSRAISQIEGWWVLVTGFILIFFGTLIDITDNFEEFSRFVIVGDTPAQAFLESVGGYTFLTLFCADVFDFNKGLAYHYLIIS